MADFIVADAVQDDGGIQIAKDFGLALGLAGSHQFLALAYAITSQADAMPDYSNITMKEFNLLAAARQVVEIYTFEPSEKVE